ncbi:MAG: RagB/SusD family nutrient uptake outer membrane protein [Prevotellaceae bacterium]|jgi:hypothetical protein|nr:RagB/SusD family nutrient uptake outer membrane protein [Prevotellaceae bacterium]
MKNSIKILTLALLAAFGASCEDILEAPTKSSMDESVIFSTPAYAKNAIAGVIQSFGETNSYRGRYYTHYGVNTDVEVKSGLSGTAEPDDKARLSNYNTNVANGEMNVGNDTYVKAYEGIERANLSIRGLRQYADLNNWELAQILGEMLTLRAVLYVDLLKGWGNVPARFEPISPATIYLPRADRDVVLKQLLADLEEAAGLVGWPNENAYTITNEHINKAFVKGLRARVALMAGGHSMHMGETAMRPSNDPDLAKDKMYAIAKKECLDVIESGTARLQPQGTWASSFEAAFRAVHAEAHVAGNEALWEIPFSTERGRVIYTWGIEHKKVDIYTAQNKGAQILPNPILFYKYRKEDVRRDITCIPYEWDNGTVSTTGNHVLRSLNSWCFGKHRYEWLNRRVTNVNDDGLNFLYMRYANVLLMAAEAVNELDGAGAAAPYLREVKERAYPENSSIVEAEMSAAIAGKTAFFNTVVDERAKELAGEMYRKEDLIRWGLLDAKMISNREDLAKLEARTAPYNNVNAKVYSKTAPDGVSLLLYGLEPGQLGDPGDASYVGKTWKLKGDTDTKTYQERLYARTPSSQPYWPIWESVVIASNGKIVNDPVFQQ